MRSEPWRLGHSNFFGTIVLNAFGEDGVCGHVFRPRPGLAAKLAPLTAATAGGRRIFMPDPIEGVTMVLRRYEADSTDFTTLSVRVHTNALPLERDQFTTASRLLLLGRDQGPAFLRDYLAESVQSFDVLESDDYTRPHQADDPKFFDFSYDLRIRPRATPFVFTDARGNPLAGAEIRLSYRFSDNRMPGTIVRARDDVPFDPGLQPIRTDAAGRVDIFLPTTRLLVGIEYRVSHPDYGQAAFLALGLSGGGDGGMMYAGFRGGRGGGLPQSRLMGGGEPQPAWTTVTTPLLRRGAPETANALRGRLVDGQGRPLAGARVTAFLKEEAGPRGWPAVGMFLPNEASTISETDGSFTWYPVNTMTGAPALPANTPLLVRVSTPDHPRMPALEAWLDNSREQTIQVTLPVPRWHTLNFVDARRDRLDAAWVKPLITRVKMSLTGLRASETVFDGTRRDATPPAEYLLAPGDYYVMNPLTHETVSFTVKPETPRAIVIPIKSLVQNVKAPEKQSRGSAPPLAYDGQVVDALSGRPLPGAEIVDSLQHKTSTDANGRFTLNVKPWEKAASLCATRDSYLPGTLFLPDSPTAGTRASLPPIRLHPAAHLRLEARPTGRRPGDSADFHGFNFRLGLSFQNPVDNSWERELPGERTDLASHSTLPALLLPNQPATLLVPAGIRFRLEIRPYRNPLYQQAQDYERWLPETVACEAELQQGETKDLGPFVFQSAALLADADLLFLQRKFVEARESFMDFINTNPRLPEAAEARCGAAECLYSLGRHDAFIEEARALLQRPGVGPGERRETLLYHLALACRDKDRWAESGDALLKFSAEYPASPRRAEVSALTTACLARLAAPEGAKPAWAAGVPGRRAPQPAPGAAAEGDPAFSRAAELFTKQQWAECRKALTQYAEAHPDSPRLREAQVKSILCLLKQEEFDAFRLEARRFMEQHPEPENRAFQSLAYHLGLAAQTQKLWCQALQGYQDYLAAFPAGEDLLPALRGRAQALLQLQETLAPPGRAAAGEGAKLAAAAKAAFADYRARLTAAKAEADAAGRKELANRLVESYYLEKDYPAEIQLLRELLPGLQPASREWAEAQLKLGIALEHLAPPRHKDAAEAFDAILAAGLVDPNVAEHLPTKAVFWRLAIARTLGEQEKFKALIELMKTMPDNPSKKSALERYDPKPAAR